MEETIALATETNGSKTSFFLISSLYDEILLMSGWKSIWFIYSLTEKINNNFFNVILIFIKNSNMTIENILNRSIETINLFANRFTRSQKVHDN